MQPHEKSVNYSLIAYSCVSALLNLFSQISTNDSRFKSVNFRNLILGRNLADFKHKRTRATSSIILKSIFYISVSTCFLFLISGKNIQLFSFFQ